MAGPVTSDPAPGPKLVPAPAGQPLQAAQAQPSPAAPVAKPKHGSIIRPIVILLVLSVAGFLIWRYMHRKEGYTGGPVTTTGTVDAVHVQLSFKVSGRLAEVAVAEGQTIEPGQLVARMETADLDVAVSNARAALENARAQRAQALATREQTTRDLARQEELLNVGAVARQQVDAARAAAGVSKAQVAAGEAQIHAAESALHQAELQRSYAVLRSSDRGLVTAKVHQPGEMVGVGTPVVTLAQVDTVKVLAAVDETRVGAVRPGDPVRIRIYTYDKRWFDGQVTDITPVGEFATRKDWGAQRRDIRTFTVTARVPNPEHLLKDGMTAEVTILVRQPAVAGASK